MNSSDFFDLDINISILEHRLSTRAVMDRHLTLTNFTAMQPYIPPALLAPYYVIIIPILLIFCFAAFLGNLALLACVPWIRRRAMTVNLRLSLSLAGADAWAALLILCGIIVNSYIPVVHNVALGPWTACYFLIFELLRLAGLITSVLHLLTLAINHWLSIVAPLKYKTLMTMGVYKMTTVILWTAPLLAMFGYGFSLPREGFRSRFCAYTFYYRFRFRFVLFLQFAVPLIIMLLIYGDILRRLAAARSGRGLKSKLRMHGPGLKRDSETYISYGEQYFLKKRRSLPWENDGKNSNRRMSDREQPIEANENGKAPFLRANSGGNSSTVIGKTKALCTTLLIVGTFAVGWLPALFVFLLVCNDCSIKTYPPEMRILAVQVVVNSLMLTKLFINPFIYGFRMLDIRYALWAMRVSRFGSRPLPMRDAPRRFIRLMNQNARY